MMHRIFFAALLSLAASGCTFSATGRVPVFTSRHVAVGAPVVVAALAPVAVSVAAPVEANVSSSAHVSGSARVSIDTRMAATVDGAAAPAGPEVSCSIEAGPLWNNDHAQRTCPSVCQGAGAIRNTGHWWTTRWAEMSVCQCAFPAGTTCPAVDDRPHEQR